MPLDYHAWTHAPKEEGGTDPIPFKTPWAHISTDDIGYEADGGTTDTVDFYSVFISDSGSQYFDYEVEANAGQFGDDRVFLRIKQGGVYTFSWLALTSDLNDSQPELKIFLDFTPLDMSLAYPGLIAGRDVTTLGQYYIGDDGGDDLCILDSITIPLRSPPVNTPARTCMLDLNYTAQPGLSEFWTVRCWVARHGPIDWDRGTFDFSDSTWNYFDGPHA